MREGDHADLRARLALTERILARRMAELTWLRTFIAIHRTGSLTAAAKQLHLTQPAISQHLKGLEAQIGWPLFTRTTRGVETTPAGDELAARIGSHLDVLESVTEQIASQPRRAHTTVHVTAPVDILASLVLPALTGLHRQGLRIVGNPGMLDEAIERVLTGEAHVAVVGQRPRNAELEVEAVFEYDAAIFASPARAAEILAARDRGALVAQGPFVAVREEMPVVRAVLRACFNLEVRARPAVIVPDLRACAAFVAAGDAIGVMARPFVAPLLASGAVIEIPPARTSPRFTAWAVIRRGTAASPRIAAVCTRLREAGQGTERNLQSVVKGVMSKSQRPRTRR
jgi:DNA-binding transcriptional LysR family regulator